MTDFNDNDYEFFGMLDRIANSADTLVQSGGGIDKEDYFFDDDDWRMFLANQWVVNAWIEQIKKHYSLYNWCIDCVWYPELRQLRFSCEWYAPDMDVPDAEDWWTDLQERQEQLTIRPPVNQEDIQMTRFDATHSVTPVPSSIGVCG